MSTTGTSSEEFPSVEYEDVISEQGLLNKDVRKKEVLKTGIKFSSGEVLYGKLRPYLHNWYNPEFQGVAVGDWWVLKPIDIDKNFLYRLVQTPQFDDMANQSSGTKMPRADWKLITSTEFYVPVDLEEQQKVGEYFSAIDHLITLHQRKCDKNKKNQFIAWEQRKLGEIAEFNPKSELPDEFEYVDLESVVGTEMVSHRTETKTTAPSRAQRLARKGDVFFQTVRPYQRNNYLFEKPDKNYVFSTGYAQMRPNIDAHYLMSFLQTDGLVKVVLDNCTGTSYPAINSSDLANIEISFPYSKEEQKKVGGCISNLDHLITLHQRKQKCLKNAIKYIKNIMITVKEKIKCRNWKR